MNNNVPFHAGYVQQGYLNEDYSQQQQVPSQQQRSDNADDNIPLDESIPHPSHISQQLAQDEEEDGDIDIDEDDEDDEDLDDDEALNDDDSQAQQQGLDQQQDQDDQADEEDEFGAGGAFANVGQGLTGRYKNMMMQYWQETINSIEHDEHDFKNHQLPLARIKKVMKTDEEVRMISAEAPILFAKGCDIFITELTMRAWIHAEENKRRTLQRSDIAAALQKSDMFDFLIDIVPREEEKPKRHHGRSQDEGLGQSRDDSVSTVPNMSGRFSHVKNEDFS